jgi:hypothetical protein
VKGMFFKFIATVFLVLFIFKILNPDVIPYMQKFWKIVNSVVKTTFYLILNGFILGFHLVIKRTIYVVGIALVVTVLFNLLVSGIIHFQQFNLSNFFSTFWDQFFDFYVLFFFLSTFILGIVEVLFKKQTVKGKMVNKFYAEVNKFQYTRVSKPKEETFVYDEESKKYHYDQ